MKLRPYVAFETPADQGTGTPPAPPEVPAAPAPPATPAPTPDAPWAADLASVFQDEAERARVDQFMREKYQPYVTQLEQKHAPARQLYDALQSENSLETYLGLAEQLYGEETANYLAEKIIEKYGEETAAPAEPAPAADDAIPFEKLPPEVQERMRKLEADEARTTYWAEMGRVQEAFKDETTGESKVDPELFHPFVVGANGDFDAALAKYQEWHAKAYPAAPAPPPTDEPAPPPTVGAETATGGPTPPVAQRYTSLDAALDDTLAEMRAARQAPPPSVGSA